MKAKIIFEDGEYLLVFPDKVSEKMGWKEDQEVSLGLEFISGQWVMVIKPIEGDDKNE